MNLKYSKGLLSKIEDILSESDYILRYEKGNFKSGYCILNDKNIVIVNKYYSLEGKINCLVEIIQKIEIQVNGLSPKSLEIYNQINQTSLEI